METVADPATWVISDPSHEMHLLPAGDDERLIIYCTCGWVADGNYATYHVNLPQAITRAFDEHPGPRARLEARQQHRRKVVGK